MGPVGFNTDRGRPRGKSKLEIILAGVAVIVRVAPRRAYHIGPAHSRQVSTHEVRVVQVDVLQCSTAQVRVAHIRPVHVEIVEVAVLHVRIIEIEIRLLEVVAIRVTLVVSMPFVSGYRA